MKSEEKLKHMIIEFMDELIDIFPLEADILFSRMLIKQSDSDKIWLEFQKSLYVHKQQIKDRNDGFFLEHTIDDLIPIEKVTHFKNLWKRIDQENKTIVFEWLDCFIEFVEQNDK